MNLTISLVKINHLINLMWLFVGHLTKIILRFCVGSSPVRSQKLWKEVLNVVDA
ncbi:hypothetical protein ACJX0J_024326, partial [Zea mays]